MKASPETLGDLIQIASGGAECDAVVARLKTIEKAHASVGLVIRVSFDIPVMTWGASLMAYHGGNVHRLNIHGAPTAMRAVDACERACVPGFWEQPPPPREAPCPKCGNTGVECYVDPSDNDTHLRPCDCPIGRAQAAEQR